MFKCPNIKAKLDEKAAFFHGPERDRNSFTKENDSDLSAALREGYNTFVADIMHVMNGGIL